MNKHKAQLARHLPGSRPARAPKEKAPPPVAGAGLPGSGIRVPSQEKFFTTISHKPSITSSEPSGRNDWIPSR